MKRTSKRDVWYRPVRGSYLPANGKGLAVYLAYLVCMLLVIAGWFGQGDKSWASLLFDTLPHLMLISLLMQLFAASKSRS